MSYIIPSMTPTSGMPAFRVYSVDPITFAVLDSTTYIADMTNPSYQTNGPIWTKYYSAKETYGPLVTPPLTSSNAELSPAFWHNVTAALSANQNQFNAYYARKTRGWNVGSCTGSCMTTEICQMQAGRAQDNCYTPTFGVHFSKRDGEASGSGTRDECGVSVTRETIGLIASDKSVLDMVVAKATELNATAKA
jgi:sphingomyelin phosphodiesterase